MTARICWECPFSDGIPTCDPSRARCPEPPLSAEEQERVRQRYEEWARQSRVWLVYRGLPPMPLNVTSGSVTDGPEVRRTIEIELEEDDL